MLPAQSPQNLEHDKSVLLQRIDELKGQGLVFGKDQQLLQALSAENEVQLRHGLRCNSCLTTASARAADRAACQLPGGSACDAVPRQLMALQLVAENEELRAELEAFDPAFFEEIEDLKVCLPRVCAAVTAPQFNYQEALRRIDELQATQ